MFIAIVIVPELKTVSLNYVEQEFSCWVCQLSLGCGKTFALKTWSSPHFYSILHLRDEMGGGEKKKKGLDTLIPSPHSCFGSWEACLKDVCMCMYREPQLKPRCSRSDLCSDKLEHILLSKDVILLLIVILALVSLVEACVMWHRVYPEWLWERATHIARKVWHREMTCAFICFLW